MARELVPAFIGPTNELRAPNVDAERTVNWYLEATAPGAGKVPVSFLPTPGMRPFAVIADWQAGAYCRGLFEQDGRAWAVVGSIFAELFPDGTSVGRGTVTNDGFPASIVSNGTAGGQLLVISGDAGYCYTLATNALVQIIPANFPDSNGFPDRPLMAEFMDGYGIVIEKRNDGKGDRTFHISGLEDFRQWDPLDVGERSEGSDSFTAVIRNHRELWFLGTKTSEVWFDSGDPLFPFAPVPGVFIEGGAIARWSAQRLSQTICWIGGNERGAGVVNVADGYAERRISTHAVERRLQEATNLTDAVAFTYQIEGHLFYWLQVPSLGTCFVYDVSTDRWHERNHWNSVTAVEENHAAIHHCYAFGLIGSGVVGRHLVGSTRNGTIYELRLDVFDDGIA